MIWVCYLLGIFASSAALALADVSTDLFSKTLNTPPWAQPQQNASSLKCRCYPGDTCWPSTSVWESFNATINGQLIATTPLAAPCHNDAFSLYNVTECADLQAAWFTPNLHAKSPSSIMAPYFANNSCNPFLPASTPCIVGTYASYSVNVSQPMDISRTLWFAAYFNIRVVVKNTGHDYNGKSTGAGAISLWTHNLKKIQMLDYTSTNYTGKAIKVGAGVQVEEAYAAASAQGLAIVGGECPTVGYAGGYTQGGGHSALSSRHGLAADQVLEWEVVDGRGRLLKANPSLNADLYWALCGGGGGSFGVVTSMISKAYQDIPVTGANISFTNAGVSQAQFYDVVELYLKLLPTIVDSGAVTVSFLSSESFAISPLTAPGLSSEKVYQLLSPLTEKLEQYNISYSYELQSFPGYLEQFRAQSACSDVGTGLYGGRLISRSVVEQKTTDLIAAFRYINNHGGVLATIGLNVSPAVAGPVWNAVHEAWRDTLIQTVIQTPYNQTAAIAENKKAQDMITYDFVPRLERLTPGGGAYLNEGDFQQPDWQQAFYGNHYRALQDIKNRFDPFHLLYAITAVGSEYWTPQQDGRLCKA
ncbi:FAD/FMN-containing isoamyl alcohol oxidase MreA [Xylaria curta]|nr:FAD/FMN-containing isoamyl alcohol oxidase MreA [Xylaria curta]